MRKINLKKTFNVSLIFCLFLLFTFLSNITNHSYASENKSTKIAVIPFKNLSSEQKYDWIGNGFAETMVSSLMNIKNIQIVERFLMSDVIKEVAFQQSGFVDENDTLKIGKMTGANIIISGSYQISNDEIVINARFINLEKSTAESGTYIRGKLSEIFNLQEKLANSFNEKFNIKLSNQEEKNIKSIIYATKSTEAQELYLKARERNLNGGGLKAMKDTIDLLEKAIKIDPNYSLAWAFLGQTYLEYCNFAKGGNIVMKNDNDKEYKNINIKYNMFDLSEDLEKFQKSGIKALEKAISLSPNYETYRALAQGFFYLHEKENYEKYLKKALELKPDDVETLLLSAFSNLDDDKKTLETIKKAEKIDPYNYLTYFYYGFYYQIKAKKENKEENLKLSLENSLKSVELNKYSWNANMRVVQTYIMLNEFDKATAWADRLIKMEDDIFSYLMAFMVYITVDDNTKTIEMLKHIHRISKSPFLVGVIAQIYISGNDYQNAYKITREELNKYSENSLLNLCMFLIYKDYFKDCKSSLYHLKISIDNYSKVPPYVQFESMEILQNLYNKQTESCKQK